MDISQTSGRFHKSGGKTFKSRRMKMAMEREANKEKVQKPRPEMKNSIRELIRG